MRAEYSELNVSKMVELAVSPIYVNLPSAREINCDDEPPIIKRDEDVIDLKFESNSLDMPLVCRRSNQVSDSNITECSRQFNGRIGVINAGKFCLGSGINNNFVGNTFQR